MKNVVILTLGVVVVFVGTAGAQLVSFSSDELYSWSSSGAIVTQSIAVPGPVDVSITADAESVFTIVSTTANETAFTWIGYILTLDSAGAATFVKGQSIQFPTVLNPNPRRLEFWDGEVLPHELVVLQFDISVPDGPPYTFSLTHTPVPEPATFALLGLGAMVLVAGRNRKK